MKWMCAIVIATVALTACSTSKSGAPSSHSGRERKAMRSTAVEAPPPVLLAPEAKQP